MNDVKFGALCWNQYTDWPSLLKAGIRADELGYNSLWTWDHLYPIVGSADGPILEGWLTLTGWAGATSKVSLGLMVGANTFREPSLTAKLATTLDHISGGRAVLGIGAAWFEAEHTAYGLRYGDGPPERLRWLGEALPVMRGMLDGTAPSASGPRYAAKAIRNDPPPVQRHLPILIGGGGEKVTLKLAARYADIHDMGGALPTVKRKDDILREHCAAIGRDFNSIDRSHGVGVVVIRDSRDEARKVAATLFEHNGRSRIWQDQPVGTPEDVAAQLAPFVEIGRSNLIAGFPSPYDEESMTRLITDVKPLLQK
jgi:alkanesulfonate monooxygenase SsuD/methylene tetrahydromethanopterin reductase-like flavin-dependent oxidoreductase (luciferase family)